MFLSVMTVGYLIPFLKYHGHNPERHVALGKVSASKHNFISPKMVLVGIRMR